MTLEEPLIQTRKTILKQEKLHPDWPTDPIHASATLNEIAGELTRAVYGFVYFGGTKEKMIEGAARPPPWQLGFCLK